MLSRYVSGVMAFAVLSLSVIAASPAGAATHTKPRPLTFKVDDLPSYVSSKSHVRVRPSIPAKVCGMSYGQQVVSTAPYDFTVSPDDLIDFGTEATAVLCKGGTVPVHFDTVLAFTLSTTTVPNSGVTEPVTLSNNTPYVAKVIVYFPSSDIPYITSVIDGYSSAVLQIQTSGMNGVGDSLSVVQFDNNFDVPILRYVRSGESWTMLVPEFGATFAPCSHLLWFYDPTGSPSAMMPADIVSALDVISSHTGLTFERVFNREAANIRYFWNTSNWHWGNSAAAVASPSGDVQFNPASPWTADDQYVGFQSPANGQYAGRAFLTIHETMHVLGLGHTSDTGQVMSPYINLMVNKLGEGDIAGLRALYPTANCAAVATSVS